VSSDDPKTAEEMEAEREAIAQRAEQTATALESLLKEAGVLSEGYDPGAFDPTSVLYDKFEARLQAEAAILEEACDIALPEIKLVAKPIRTAFSEPSENLAELETLCGSLPARHRQAEWLDVPAFHLDGATNFLGAFTDAQDGDTGSHISKAYYLLVDGRLVEVHGIGTWALIGKELRDVRRTIVSSREVTPKEVVGDVNVADVFMKLRHSLHLSLQGLEGKHVPDLGERRARFDEIVMQYTSLVQRFAEGLRRVGDSPA
jgi:hypothetical protein